MYDTILFPTDGSDGAEAAFEHAVEQAQQYDAALHILFVAEHPLIHSGMVGEEHEEIDRSEMVGEEHVQEEPSGLIYGDEEVAAFEAHGQKVVDDLADTVEDDIDVKTAVLNGNPYERIQDYSDEHGVDLIVMGAHGRTGIDRYLLGSVTEKVVRTADAPVLTVRRGESEATA